MKYTIITATIGLMAVSHADSQTPLPTTTERHITAAPHGGIFVLRPTPTLRLPRYGLLAVRADDDGDGDGDGDGDEGGNNGWGGPRTGSPVTSSSGDGGGGTQTTGPVTRSSNTCGWDKNGGGLYACRDSQASCVYTDGAAGCCQGSGSCNGLPRACLASAQVQQEHGCHGGNVLCCQASSAPHCYTWIISASTMGRQETYSLFDCTDRAGSGVLLSTDPVNPSSSSSSSALATSSGSQGSSTSGGHSNTGAIVGGVIGGLLALLLLALLAWYVLRQRRSHRTENAETLAARRKQAENEAVGSSAWPTQHHGRGQADAENYGSNVGCAEGQRSLQGKSLPIGPHMTEAGVVEAPDTRLQQQQQQSDAPVEAPGTKITRDTIQNRAELG